MKDKHVRRHPVQGLRLLARRLSNRPQQQHGVCLDCDMLVYQLRDVGTVAAWRSSPRTHADLLATILASGFQISPLLTLVPWIHSRCFRVDWLHCADIGVTADFLGNIMYMVLPKLPGASAKLRCVCFVVLAAAILRGAAYRGQTPESGLDDDQAIQPASQAAQQCSRVSSNGALGSQALQRLAGCQSGCGAGSKAGHVSFAPVLHGPERIQHICC